MDIRSVLADAPYPEGRRCSGPTICVQAAQQRRGAADRSEHRQAAGAVRLKRLDRLRWQGHENAKAIEYWRQGLPERERKRKRLINPQSVVKRWQRETHHGNGRCPTDLKREAKAAWKRFVWCVRSLPVQEAEALRQMALAEMAATVVPAPIARAVTP